LFYDLIAIPQEVATNIGSKTEKAGKITQHFNPIGSANDILGFVRQVDPEHEEFCKP